HYMHPLSLHDALPIWSDRQVASIRLRTSYRSRTTKAQSRRISSVGSRRSGTMIVIMPADDAARTPLCESSSARHKYGSRPSRSRSEEHTSELQSRGHL